MARIRTIKPGFWKDEDLCALPEATHMLAAALINYADDDGYFNANPALIKGEFYPLREPSVSIHDSLSELSRIGWIRLGKGADGKTYGHIRTFSVHQKINRPTPSKIKELPISWDHSVSLHGALSEPSLPEGNKEGNKEYAVGSEIPPAAASAEVELYRRGKEILGSSSGGLIKKLVTVKGGNIALARAALETASTKSDPREYIGATIRGRDSKEDLRARGEAW